MTVIRGDVFLLLIAVFTGCLVLTGWLRARNRSETPTVIDWAAAIVMTSTAAAMGVWSIVLLRQGSALAVVLVVFALIVGALALSDLHFLRRRAYRGTLRIAVHLGRMLGGTIAALTAFTVVNVRIEPAFVPWLMPTILLTPLIFYWVRRLSAPRLRASPALVHAAVWALDLASGGRTGTKPAPEPARREATNRQVLGTTRAGDRGRTGDLVLGKPIDSGHHTISAHRRQGKLRLSRRPLPRPIGWDETQSGTHPVHTCARQDSAAVGS